ncbi:MAG: pilus assembly protein PilM [Anaerolineales bacterium]|nr:pilus assembly protein PilM [Anaerolineales bacterium]
MFKRKLTTINFEGNDIRFLIVQGQKILSWSTRKVPPEIMNQGQIQEPGAVGRLIQSTLKNMKAPRRHVITSVIGQRSVHRIMRIPNIQEKLLEETIRRKAKQEFAIPVDEADLSWRVISQTSNEIILYVVAVPNVIIDQQVKTLRAAKIRPKVMDIKPLALQRLVNQKTSIIINLESFSMGVIIVVNHIPVLIRTVALETGDLTDEAKVDLLSQELARTVKYYNESNKKNRLPEETQVFTTGELFEYPRLESRLEDSPNLAERLQENTPYTVSLPKPALEIPPQLSVAKYAVNLGLALKNKK